MTKESVLGTSIVKYLASMRPRYDDHVATDDGIRERKILHPYLDMMITALLDDTIARSEAEHCTSKSIADQLLFPSIQGMNAERPHWYPGSKLVVFMLLFRWLRNDATRQSFLDSLPKFDGINKGFDSYNTGIAATVMPPPISLAVNGYDF